MNSDLRDTTWMQSGISILWDADALNGLCPADSVRSLRELLRLYEGGWPEHGLNLVNKRTLVITGLEATMDTLSPDEAVEWLEQKVYPAIRSFQDSVADGGGEAALILWFADQRRLAYTAADNTHHWYCAGQHRSKSIPIGRCIWNGAESSVRKIVTFGADGKQRHIGLFLRRIS